MNEVVQLILDFVNDNPDLGKRAWDDFICIRQKDPKMEKIRREVLDIEVHYPSNMRGEWCSDEGVQELKKIARRLQQELK